MSRLRALPLIPCDLAHSSGIVKFIFLLELQPCLE
jgi:hypothetical protein